MNTEMSFDSFTCRELARAIELLVAPDQLMSRETMSAILASLGFTPEEVREQLDEDAPLNDDPMIQWSF